jgi:hypothetical protein
MMDKKGFQSKQVGASLIAILTFLALLVFSLNFIVRIFSLHWDDKLLVSILDDLPQAITRDTSVKQVRKLIDNRLDVNSLRSFPTTQLVITKKKGQINLIWQYERREHVMSNVDITLTFNHEYNY